MKTQLEIKELQDALIYTKEAFARIFGVQTKRIKRVMVWAVGYWVWVQGKRPRLYKKALFQTHFVNFRKESAKKLTIASYIPGATTEFFIKNEAEGTVSYVGYTRDAQNKPRYACGCGDFKALKEAFNAPACKHIYAVLGYQGYASIKDAIAQHQKEYDARLALGI
jgi:hypothetical protein